MKLTDTNCSWGLTLSFEELRWWHTNKDTEIKLTEVMRYTEVWACDTQHHPTNTVDLAWQTGNGLPIWQFKFGGHSELVPRLPIPNRIVKRLSADDSMDTHVKVGHRQTPYNKPLNRNAQGLILWQRKTQKWECFQATSKAAWKESWYPSRKITVQNKNNFSVISVNCFALGWCCYRQCKNDPLTAIWNWPPCFKLAALLRVAWC